MPYQNHRAGAPLGVKRMDLEGRTYWRADHVHVQVKAIFARGVCDCVAVGAEAREQAEI